MRVAQAEAERARATLIGLFPEGFEEQDLGREVEFAAYTEEAGEARLRSAFGEVESSDVEAGWEERWRAFHKPVRVGELWIGPPWIEPPPDATPVVIDPGRAFGTGAHATTRLCLEFVREQPRGSLLDLGCGSGVIAIAAVKLGFRPVLALDRDADAVEATLGNAERNGVAVDTRVGDALTADLPERDLVVANIEAGAVGALAPRLRCRALIASGYYWSERAELAGFRRLERRTEERWAADLYERE